MQTDEDDGLSRLELVLKCIYSTDLLAKKKIRYVEKIRDNYHIFKDDERAYVFEQTSGGDYKFLSWCKRGWLSLFNDDVDILFNKCRELEYLTAKFGDDVLKFEDNLYKLVDKLIKFGYLRWLNIKLIILGIMKWLVLIVLLRVLNGGINIEI